jgi:arsenate reductase (thioredoxin)
MPLRILVLCTGNSARSILAEALFNELGQGRVRAYSAGSQPTGVVNPYALTTLAAHGIQKADARSKKWDEFLGVDAPKIDLVVTVCGSAADEACPYFPGDWLITHWGIDDPAHVPEPEKAAAFELAYQRLHKKISAFFAVDFERLQRDQLATVCREIASL